MRTKTFFPPKYFKPSKTLSQVKVTPPRDQKETCATRVMCDGGTINDTHDFIAYPVLPCGTIIIIHNIILLSTLFWVARVSD